MSHTFDLQPIFTYLKKLKKNNSKAWFDENRAEYDRARGLFEGFIDQMIDAVVVNDGTRVVSARDCMFRLNRDVRFSKDKSPYKTNFSAVVGPGGRKSTDSGYYVSLEPGNQSMIAGGMHMPTPDQLARFREAVAADSTPLRKIVAARKFKEMFGDLHGSRLATAPKGYDKGHPDIDLLRLKEVTVVHQIDDVDVVKPQFLRHAVKVCSAMGPFLDYLSASLQHR